jgi:hypothetical protein
LPPLSAMAHSVLLLGPAARGEEVVVSGVAAGRGLLPKVRALWMVGRGWCCCWGAVDGADG